MLRFQLKWKLPCILFKWKEKLKEGERAIEARGGEEEKAEKGEGRGERMKEEGGGEGEKGGEKAKSKCGQELRRKEKGILHVSFSAAIEID